MITKFNHIILGNEIPQLKDISNYVVIKCATKWKHLGRNLNIEEDLLSIYEKDNPNNCEDCCIRMLSEWLDSTPDASWEMLLNSANNLQFIGNNSFIICANQNSCTHTCKD